MGGKDGMAYLVVRQQGKIDAGIVFIQQCLSQRNIVILVFLKIKIQNFKNK